MKPKPLCQLCQLCPRALKRFGIALLCGGIKHTGLLPLLVHHRLHMLVLHLHQALFVEPQLMNALSAVLCDDRMAL